MKLSKEEIALIEKARAKHAKKTAKKAKAAAKPAKAKKLGRPKGSKNKTTKAVAKPKVVKVPKAKTGTKPPPTLGEVKEAIAALQTPSMREKALELLASNVPNIRTGSSLFEKEMKEKTERTGNEKYLGLIVSDAEKRAMAKLSEAGLAFRHIEAVFHLLPANGMNAYRCVLQARAEAKKMIRAANKQGANATKKKAEAPKVEVETKTEAPAAPVAETAPVTVEAPAPVETAKVVVTVEGAANVEVKTAETAATASTEPTPEEVLAVQ